MVGTEDDGERTGGERADGEPSDDDGEHVCEACGKEFPTEAELEEHVLEQGIVE